MRKHRFFIDAPLSVGQQVNLPTDILHQITRVLRLPKGAELYLFNNSGQEFQAVLDAKTAEIIAATTQPAPRLKIHLAQVIGKGDKMDLVIQKATELGAMSITPLFSQHSISNKTNKLDHWQKIAIAAACQCWRTDVPIIQQALALTEWIGQPRDGLGLILSPDGTKIQQQNISSPLTLLVGPEGGFSADEYALAQQANFVPIGLGPRILRTETAGIAAIAILQALAGDM